jgi:deoxyribodipyrimidine photo-lyase
MGTVVFLFHRDLRIVDHGGFSAAVEWANTHSAKVLPLFVFTPEQVTRNPYRSPPSIQFMLDSLEDLEAAIREQGGTLRCAYGATVDILGSIAGLAAVFETRDYTPYAKQREEAIRSFCEREGIVYEAVEDMYLTAPGSVRTGTGRTFQKFTPFWTSAQKRPVPKPRGVASPIAWASRIRISDSVTLSAMRRKLVPTRLTTVQKGGRTEGLKCVVPRNYETTHDRLDAPTSHLSAHNHFGTLSIREVYWSTSQEAFRRQLYWRDFYGHIMADFEGLYGVSAYEFQAPKEWRKGEKEVFEAWSKGETGVELVDAAMRELHTTGFMHNRARLVVASWLVKDKGVHWRWGERFFAQHLVDYDPAQNMMNWIWVASVLPFASAPFRRHDPERTAERLDPDRVYRNRWAK